MFCARIKVCAEKNNKTVIIPRLLVGGGVMAFSSCLRKMKKILTAIQQEKSKENIVNLPIIDVRTAGRKCSTMNVHHHWVVSRDLNLSHK